MNCKQIWWKNSTERAGIDHGKVEIKAKAKAKSPPQLLKSPQLPDNRMTMNDFNFKAEAKGADYQSH